MGPFFFFSFQADLLTNKKSSFFLFSWAHTRACDFQDLFVCEQELFISEKHPFVSLKVATLSSQQAWLLLLGGSRCCPLGLLPPDTGVHAVTRRPVSTAFRQTAPCLLTHIRTEDSPSVWESHRRLYTAVRVLKSG